MTDKNDLAAQADAVIDQGIAKIIEEHPLRELLDRAGIVVSDKTTGPDLYPADLTGRFMHMQILPSDEDLTRWVDGMNPVLSMETGEPAGRGKSMVAEVVERMLPDGVMVFHLDTSHSMPKEQIDQFLDDVREMMNSKGTSWATVQPVRGSGTKIDLKEFKGYLEWTDPDRPAGLLFLDELPYADAETQADWNRMVDRHLDIGDYRLNGTKKSPHMVVVNEAHALGTAVAKKMSKSFLRAEREDREGHRRFEHRRPDGSFKKGRRRKK